MSDLAREVLLETRQSPDYSAYVDDLFERCDSDDVDYDLFEELISGLENHTSPLKRSEEDPSKVYLDSPDSIVTYCRKLERPDTDIIEFADSQSED